MAKDSLDDMNLDDDMWSDLDSDDFSFNGDFDNDGDQIEKKSGRSPITDHLKSVGADLMSAGRGAAEGASAGIASTVAKEFPEVSNFKDFAMQGLADAQRAKDDILKQITPVLSDAKQTARKFSQIAENAFPNAGVFKKISSLLEEPKDDYREKKASIEEMRNSAIDAELSKVFAVQAQERAIDRKEATIERLIDKRESRANNAQLTALIGEIRTDTLFQASFMRSSATAYMKKSLELKYRHLFVAQDTLEALKLTTKSMETRLDAIKHNTALPDAQKIRLVERAINSRKEKLATSLTDQAAKLFDHARKKVMEDYIEPALDQFSLIVDSLDMSADMLEQGQEFGLSTRDMAIGQGGGFIGGLLGGDFMKKIISKIPKHVRNTIRQTAGGGKESVLSFLQRAKDGTWDWGDSEAGEEGTLQKVITKFAEFIPDIVQGHGVFSNPGNNALDDGKITNKFVRTVEEIIPRYLSMQTKYLEQLATGKPAEERVWDWKTNKFTTVDKLKASLKTRVFGTKEQHNRAMLDSANEMRKAISSVHYETMDEEEDRAYNGKLLSTFEGISADFTFCLLNMAHAKKTIADKDINAIEDFAKTGSMNAFCEMFFKDVKNAQAVAKKMVFLFQDPNGRLNQQMLASANNRIIDLMKGFEYELKKIQSEITNYGYESYADNILEKNKSGDYIVNETAWKNQYKFSNKDIASDRVITAEYWGTDLETKREKFQKMVNNIKDVISDMQLGEKWEDFKDTVMGGIVGFIANRFDIKPEEIEEQIETAKKKCKGAKDYVAGKLSSFKTTLKKPAYWAVKLLHDKLSEKSELAPFVALVWTDEGTLRDDPRTPEEVKLAIDQTGAVGDWCINYILTGSDILAWSVRETLLMDDLWHDVLLLYDREFKDSKKKDRERAKEEARNARLIGTKPEESGRGINMSNTAESYAKKIADHDGIVIGNKTFIRDKTTGKYKVESEADVKNLLSQRADLRPEDIDLSALKGMTKRKTTYEKIERNKNAKPLVFTKKLNEYAESGFVTPYTLEEIVGTRLDKIITGFGVRLDNIIEVLGSIPGAKKIENIPDKLVAGADKTMSAAERDKIVADYNKKYGPKMKGTTVEYKAYEGMNDAEILNKILGNRFMYTHYGAGGIREQTEKDRKTAIEKWSKEQVENYFKGARFNKDIGDIPYKRASDGMQKTITKNDKGQFVIDSEEALEALIDTIGGLNFATDIDITPWIDIEFEKTGVKLTSKQIMAIAENQLGGKYQQYQKETKQYADHLAAEEARQKSATLKSESSAQVGMPTEKEIKAKREARIKTRKANQIKVDETAWRIANNIATDAELTDEQKKQLADHLTAQQDARTNAAKVKNRKHQEAAWRMANNIGPYGVLNKEQRSQFKTYLSEKQKADADKSKDATVGNANKISNKQMMEIDAFVAGLNEAQLQNMQDWTLEYCPELDEYEAKQKYWDHCKHLEKSYKSILEGKSNPNRLHEDFASDKLYYGYAAEEYKKKRFSGVLPKYKRKKSALEELTTHGRATRFGRVKKGALTQNQLKIVRDFMKKEGISEDAPLSDLTARQKRKLLNLLNRFGFEDEANMEIVKTNAHDEHRAKILSMTSHLIGNNDMLTSNRALETYENNEFVNMANGDFGLGDSISEFYDTGWAASDRDIERKQKEAASRKWNAEFRKNNSDYDDEMRRWQKARNANKKARGGTISAITGQDAGTVDGPTLIAGGHALAGEHGVETIVPHNKTDDAIRAYLEAKAYHEGNTFARGGSVNAGEPFVMIGADKKPIFRSRNYEQEVADIIDGLKDDNRIKKSINRHKAKLDGIKRKSTITDKEVREFKAKSDEQSMLNKFADAIVEFAPELTKAKYRSRNYEQEVADIIDGLKDDNRIKKSINRHKAKLIHRNPAMPNEQVINAPVMSVEEKPKEAPKQEQPQIVVVNAGGEQNKALVDRALGFLKKLPGMAKDKGNSAIDKIKKAAVEQSKKVKGKIDNKLSEKDFGFGEDILDRATKEMNENFIKQQAILNPTLNEKQNKAVNDAIKSGSEKAADKLEKLGLDKVAQTVREHGAGFDANEAIATVKDKAVAAKDYVTAKIQALWGKLRSLTTKNTYKEIWNSIVTVFDATTEDVEVAEKLKPGDRAFLKKVAELINEGDYRLSKLEIPDDASPELKQAIMLYQDKIRESAANMSDEELAKSHKNSFFGGIQDRIAKSARNFLDNEHVKGAVGWAKVSWNNFKEWVPKIPELIMKKLTDLFSLGKEKMIDVVTDIRALVNVIAMKTVGGENFDMDVIRNIETMSITKKLPMSERIWRATKKGAKAAVKGVKWAVTQPLSAARHLVTNKKAEVFAKPAGDEPLNRAKHVRITDHDWDNGVFHDIELKKPCKSIADIKGVVYNYRGEPLFTEGEWDRGLITADGEPIKNLGSRIGRAWHNTIAFTGGKALQAGKWGLSKLAKIPGFDIAKKGFNLAKTAVGTPFQIYKGMFVKFKDVYLKDAVGNGPLVTARELKSGLLVFMDGKPIKDVYSIDRPVKYTDDPANGDLAGQYAITNDHLVKGLVDEKNKPIAKFGNKFGALLGRGVMGVGKILRGAGGITGKVLSTLWGIAASGGKKLFEKKNPFIDVYNSEGKLLLLGRGIKENEYVFESGKPVESAYIITEEVYERKDHNKMVTKEDIENGLYDVKHRKLTKWRGRSIGFKALTAGFVGAKWAFGKAWGGLKKIGKVLGRKGEGLLSELASGGSQLFDYFHNKMIETVDAIKNSRAVTPKDLESIVGERLDKMLVLLENIKDNGASAFDDIDLRGMKGNKRLRFNKIKQARENAKQANDTKEKKINGDKDGDGIRDNSYEDQMRKKKEKAAAKKGQLALPPGVGAANVPGAIGEAAEEEGGFLSSLGLGDIWDAISTGGDIKDAIKNSRLGQKARKIGQKGRILAGRTKRGFGKAGRWLGGIADKATGGRAGKAFDAARGRAGQLVGDAKSGLSQYANGVKDQYKQFGTKVKGKTSQLMGSAKEKAGQYAGKAKDIGGKAFDAAKGKLGTAVEGAKSWGGKILGGIKNVGSGALNVAKNAVGALGKTSMGSKVLNVGGKLAGVLAKRMAATTMLAGTISATGVGTIAGGFIMAAGTLWSIYGIGKAIFGDSDAEKSFEKIRYEAYGVSDDYDDEVEDMEDELYEIVVGKRQPFTDDELDDFADDFDFGSKKMGLASLAVTASNPLGMIPSITKKDEIEKAKQRRKDYFKTWVEKRIGPIYNACYTTLSQALSKKPGEEIDWDEIDDIEGGDAAKIRVLNLMRERIKQILAQPAIPGIQGITIKDIKPDKDSYMKFVKMLDEKEKEKATANAKKVSEIKFDEIKGEYYFTVGDKRFSAKDKTEIEKMRIDKVNELKEEKHKAEISDAKNAKTDNGKLQTEIDEYKKKADVELKKSQDKTAVAAGIVAGAEAASKSKTKVPANQNDSNIPDQNKPTVDTDKGFFASALNTLETVAILANPITAMFTAAKWLFGDSDTEKSFNKVRFEAYGLEEKYSDEAEDLEDDLFDIFFDGDSPMDDDDIKEWAREFKFFSGVGLITAAIVSDSKTFKEVCERKLAYFKTWLERRFMPVYRLCYTKLVTALGKKLGDDIDWDDIDDLKGDDKVKAAFIKDLTQSINQILSKPAFPENPSSSLTVRDIKPTEEAYGRFVNEVLANKAKDVTEKLGHKISKVAYDENSGEYFFTVDGKRYSAESKIKIEKLYIDVVNKLKLEKHEVQVQEQKTSHDIEVKTQTEIDAYKEKADAQLKAAQNKASSGAGTISGGPTSAPSGPSSTPRSVNISGATPAVPSGGSASVPVANNAAGAAVSGSILSGAMLSRPGAATSGTVIQTLTGGDGGAPSQAAQQSTRIDTSGIGNIPGIDKDKLARQFLNTKLTRGIRNNNPMNVTVSGWSRKRPGFVDGDREVKGSGTPAPIGRGKYGMCRFIAPEYGIATAVCLIKDVYAKKGKTTIRSITYYYSPPHENDTEGLIAAYCKASGFKPNEPINWDNQQACFAYVKMIIKRESGKAYDDALILRGFMMGLGKADSTGAIKSDTANQPVSAEDAKEPKQESIPANISSPSVGTPSAQPVEKKEAPKLDTIPKAPVVSSTGNITDSSAIKNATANKTATVGTSSVQQPSSSNISLSVSGGAGSTPAATPTTGSVSGGGAAGSMPMGGAGQVGQPAAGVPGAGAAPMVDMSQIPASATPPKGDANELGSYVSKYESGTKGSACVAYDREGGTSYGTYQLSSRRGSLKEFVQWCQSKAPEVYTALNPYLAQSNTGSKTGDFPNRWLALVKEGKINYKLEHDYYVEKFYTPALKRLAKLNPAAAQAVSTSRALQEAYWSTAVQHGAYNLKYGAPGIFSRTYKPGMDVPSYLRAIYADRSLRFRDPKVLKGIRNRFKEELSSMLYLHQTYGNQVASTNSSASGAAEAAASAGSASGSAGGTTGAGMPVPVGADAPGAVPGGNNVTLTMSGNSGAGGVGPMAGTTFIPSGPVDMSGIKLQSNIDFENVHPAVKQRFAAMSKEYMAMFGKPVVVTSGKRSMEKQEYLYRTLPRGKAAKPNPLAPHICGLAIDADSTAMNKADSAGLLAKYGLWRPLKNGLGSCPKEAWHVEIQGSRDPVKKIITEGSLASINAAYASSAPDPNVSTDQSISGPSVTDTSANGIQSLSPLQQAKIDNVGSGSSPTGAPTIGGTPTGGPNISLGGTSGGTPTTSPAGGMSAGGASAAAPAAGSSVGGGSLSGAAPTISAGTSSSAPMTAGTSSASISTGAPAPTIGSVSTVSTFPSCSSPSISSNTISQTGQISAPIENNSQLEELKIISQLLSSIRSDMKDYYTKLEAQSLGGMIDNAKEKAGQLADKTGEEIKQGASALKKDATKLGSDILEGAGQAKDALVGALMDVIQSAKKEMNTWENSAATRERAGRLYAGYTEPINMSKQYPTR